MAVAFRTLVSKPLSPLLSRSFSASLALLRRPSIPVLRLRPLVALADIRRFSPAASSVRCFSSRPTTSSLNDPSPNWSNRPPKETILLDGCDFEHWLVVMEPPEGNPTRDEIIDSYIKTLAQIVGSEDEARMKIYSVSTKHYFAFGCLVSEELSYKIKPLPRVRWVLPDSYLDVKNKDYGGEPFIDGKAVPYDPKYHEEWVRNNARANERSRRNDRPRNFDRSRNFERRRENMQNREFQRDMPPMNAQSSTPNAGPGGGYSGMPHSGPPGGGYPGAPATSGAGGGYANMPNTGGSSGSYSGPPNIGGPSGGYSNMPSSGGPPGGFSSGGPSGPGGGYSNMPNSGGPSGGPSSGYSNMPGGGPSGGYSNMPGGGPSGGYSNVTGGGYSNMPSGGPSGGYSNMPGGGTSGGYSNMPGGGGYSNAQGSAGPSGGYSNMPNSGPGYVPNRDFQPSGGMPNRDYQPGYTPNRDAGNMSGGNAYQVRDLPGRDNQ